MQAVEKPARCSPEGPDSHSVTSSFHTASTLSGQLRRIWYHAFQPGLTLEFWATQHGFNMSIWFFLSEWFGDIPTYGTLLRRIFINSIVSIAFVYLCLAVEAPDLYGELILLSMFVANGVLMHVHRRQRSAKSA